MNRAINAQTLSAPLSIYDDKDLAFTSPQDDCELFRLCSEYHILERINREFWQLEDPNFWVNLHKKHVELARKISVRPPRTLQGYRAVARAITGWTPGMPSDEISDLNHFDTKLLTFLLRSLVQD